MESLHICHYIHGGYLGRVYFTFLALQTVAFMAVLLLESLAALLLAFKR